MVARGVVKLNTFNLLVFEVGREELKCDKRDKISSLLSGIGTPHREVKVGIQPYFV